MTKAESAEEYTARITHEVMNAILQASEMENETRDMYVRLLEACNACVFVMGALIATSSHSKSPTKQRILVEHFARDLRLAIIDAREIYEVTPPGWATIIQDEDVN